MTKLDKRLLESVGSLSGDIRFLGSLLGMVIREQHDSRAFDLVEEVRAAAKARRLRESYASVAMFARQRCAGGTVPRKCDAHHGLGVH